MLLELLNSMDKDTFEEYLINKIASLNISGEESLILSRDYISKLEADKGDKDAFSNNFIKMVKEKINTTGSEGLIKKINHELRRTGKKGNISISEEPGNFQGGFILERNGEIRTNTCIISLLMPLILMQD